MSADDQRAAEERVLELCDMDYERAAATAAEFDRLRAELAETRAAGDALAFAVAPIERMGRGAPGSRLDVLITRAEEWRSVRGDAPAPAEPPTQVEGAWLSKVIPAEPPAVELPVTLSSVDDVAAVCLAHGLTVRSSGPGWTQWRDPDTKAVVHCEAWQSGVERVTVAGRDRADIYRPVARGTLVAAIEAAWGGSR